MARRGQASEPETREVLEVSFTLDGLKPEAGSGRMRKLVPWPERAQEREKGREADGKAEPDVGGSG